MSSSAKQNATDRGGAKISSEADHVHFDASSEDEQVYFHYAIVQQICCTKSIN